MINSFTICIHVAINAKSNNWKQSIFLAKQSLKFQSLPERLNDKCKHKQLALLFLSKIIYNFKSKSKFPLEICKYKNSSTDSCNELDAGKIDICLYFILASPTIVTIYA
jgi:hypothetical protein